MMRQGHYNKTGVYGKAGVYLSGRNLEDGAFSGAVSIGYNQHKINGQEISFRDSEPLIVNQNIFYPDIGLGIAFLREFNPAILRVIYSMEDCLFLRLCPNNLWSGLI